ncbi:MAG: hypothetical protein JO279_06975 [Verrucomicrobia bacterium]|nr:hypothetical protein [Verrucomicrobiota bacterium]
MRKPVRSVNIDSTAHPEPQPKEPAFCFAFFLRSVESRSLALEIREADLGISELTGRLWELLGLDMYSLEGAAGVRPEKQAILIGSE